MAGKLFAKHVVRKAFLEDWGLKLTALVITLGLWFGVTGLSMPTERRLTVPLNLIISNGMEITNEPRGDVEIEISGDKRKIDQQVKSDFVASLDLTDVPAGDHLVSLSPDDISVNLPQGITLKSVVQPTRIAVNLEAVEEKDVEVKVQADGDPAATYEVYNSTVIPPSIRVRGPASFIKTLDFVKTDKIDLTGKKEEFTARQVPVSVSNPKAAVLNTVVDVFFRIGEKRVERAFSIPVTGSPGKTASFTIYGPRTLLAKTRSDNFKIDMSSPDTPQVILPAELQDLVEVRKLRVK